MGVTALPCGAVQGAVGELLWAQGDDVVQRLDPVSQFGDTVAQWPDVDDARAVGVDLVTGRVYWAQAFGDRIVSADATGADTQLVAEWPAVDGVVALAVDSAAGKIYWAQSVLFGDEIRRADLDGANVETLVGWPDVDGPVGVALDVAGGKLYWAQSFNDEIKQANLDGTQVAVMAQWPEVDDAAALAFDAAGSRLFWAQQAPQDDRIRMVDLLGNPAQTVVSWPNVDTPVALGVSSDGADLYWARSSSNADQIRRSDTTGGNIVTVVSWPEVSAPRAIALTEPTGCSAPSVTSLGSRYVSVTVAPGSEPVALRVVGDANSPGVSCVSGYVQADGSLGVSPVFATPASWGTLPVFGEWVTPQSRYVIRSECGSEMSSAASSPRGVTTWRRGDTDNNLTTDFLDVSRAVGGFLGDFGSGTPPLTVEMADVAADGGGSCSVNGVVNFRDIAAIVNAFLGDPDPCLSICP